MTFRGIPSSIRGRESKRGTGFAARIRCCESCLARGVRVSHGCLVDGDVACGVCGARPSRGVIGPREVAP